MWTRVIAEGRPHLLVAREGATVIGWMSLGSCRDLDAPASRAEVWAIYVAPGAWSQGVGQALWQQARGLMHLWGHATCSLWVLEGNKRAIRFYRRAGFVADERSALVTELGGCPGSREALPVQRGVMAPVAGIASPGHGMTWVASSAPLPALFETPRLRVRRWLDADLPALVAVYGDADAMRWVGDGRPITHDECLQWLEVTRRNYEIRGYGMFAIESRAATGAIGFCGIVHPGGQPEAEVKYALRRDQWGQGLATEAVSGLIAHGHRVHGLTQLIATTAPANLASHRVLLKAGMARGELRVHDDGSSTQCFCWRADAPPGPAGAAGATVAAG